MFYAWFGIALWVAGKSKDAYEYCRIGLELGERTGDQKVIGYACTWLAWACWEQGLFAEGIGYGDRAQEIAKLFPSDQYLFFKSLSALCGIYSYMGDTRRVIKTCKQLLEYGERNTNSRSQVFGHFIQAFGYLGTGDIKSAQKSSETAIEVALDPFYAQFPKYTLGAAYFLSGRLEDAKNVLQSGIQFFEEHGAGELSVGCQIFLAPTLIAEGQMQQGMVLIKKMQNTLIRNKRRVMYALLEYILGEVYSQIATGPKPSLSIIAKNIGFLVKNVPFATKRAEEHFNKAIEILKELGVKGYLGMAYLSLGLLYKATKRTDQARQSILEAIYLFKECEADVWLKQANEALDSLV
jgi:tetratricopeptide (TPR) repeat protein